MTFRRTAALGLSALILAGNVVSPADAASLILSNQTGAKQQLSQMIDHHLLLALAEQQQLSQVSRKKPDLLSQLNPFNGFTGQKSTKPAPIAKSVPISKATRAMAKPIPKSAEAVIASAPVKTTKAIKAAKTAKAPAQRVKTVRKVATKKQKNANTGIQAAAVPLSPTIAANPAITAETQASATPISTVTPTQANDTATKSETTTQPAMTAESADSNTQAIAPIAQAETKSQAPIKFEQIYQTRGPVKQTISKARTNEETFQMLAASPLDKLVMQTRNAGSMFAPGLDNAPDVSTRTKGNVKVLKSGISQKVTTVDLAIGKAEVLYLSKPASRVSVSNPEVATAVVISPTQIQLVGKSIGVANLLIWGDMVSPEHTVVDVSVHRDVSVLVNQLKYVDPGIQIMPMAAEDTVILTGQAETRETAQLAIEMAKAFFNKSAAGASIGNNGPNSQAPGSALPGVSTNVINLIKVKGEPSTKVELVRQRLNEIDPNIRVDVVPGPEGNEKVILTGRVATASIASKALNLASVFYGQPGMKLVTAQGGNEFSRMTVSGSSNGSSTSTSSGGANGAGSGGVNMLQGSVMTDATGNVISMLEIAQKPQIRCSIKFLELKKTALNAIGHTVSGVRGATKFSSNSGAHSSAPGNPISAPSSQNAPGVGWATSAARGALGNGWSPTGQSFNTNWNEVFQSGVTQVFTINNTMVAAIQALQEKRQIRTLAEPTLTMLSGEQGSFLAGGEIPVAFLGGNGQISIEFHEYGIRLNLLPNVTDDGKIQMQVSPEVSAVDSSVSVQGVPGFTTRRMSTNLIVEPNQSFALAGLYNQEDTDSVSRFPGLGNLPILGSFFRNKWKTGNNTELVVLIKPEIIYSQTGSTTPQVGEAPASPTQVSKK